MKGTVKNIKKKWFRAGNPIKSQFTLKNKSICQVVKLNI